MKFDISTAYLNAHMPDKDLVHMTLDKQMSEILMKCDESNECMTKDFFSLFKEKTSSP